MFFFFSTCTEFGKAGTPWWDEWESIAAEETVRTWSLGTRCALLQILRFYTLWVRAERDA